MKKRTAWAFLLIFWLLLFSTIFALRVERLMMPSVVTTSVTSGATVPIDCIFYNENGEAVLYQTYEGTDWEEGMRVSVVPSDRYTVSDGQIQINSVNPIVRYSSKLPRSGEAVNTVNSRLKRDDTFLVVGSFNLKENLPENYTIVGQNSNAVLISAEKVPQTFMAKQAAGELLEDSSNAKIYSLADVQIFCSGLIVLSVIFGIVPGVFILWSGCGFMLKSLKKSRFALVVNGSIAAAGLIVIAVLLQILDLPSSLLPQDSIVDISHYISEFAEIFAALKSLSSSVPAMEVLTQLQTTLWGAAAALIAPMILAEIIIAVQIKRQNRPPLKHAK